MVATKDELLEALRPSNQMHLVDRFDAITDGGDRAAFATQIQQIAPLLPHMNRVFQTSMNALTPSSTASSVVTPPKEEDFFFVTNAAISANIDHKQHVATLRQRGLDAIRQGKVAILVLAGGSGTRLGQSFPKGMLMCPDLVQQKSLFQLQCEKVKRLEVVANCPAGRRIPLLFMTSPQTDADTRQFLTTHQHFGLSPDQVYVFAQSALPCYSKDGRVLLETPSRVATAPGGNGGVYEALSSSGVLATLKSQGVEYVQVVTVDNLLVKLGDPAMVGYADEQDADVVVKSTPKVCDTEAVGVFAKRNDKWGVVEYTEIGTERAGSKDEHGRRVFDCANIAIHLMRLSFLEVAAEEMRTYEWYHAALKSIPTVDGPVAGVKLEAFIFDIFEFSKRFRILQVDRCTEFSPIKNSDDEARTKPDTPFTAVRDLHRMHTEWVINACGSAAAREGVQYEVSPLASYDGEGLEAMLEKALVGVPSNGIVLLE